MVERGGKKPKSQWAKQRERRMAYNAELRGSAEHIKDSIAEIAKNGAAGLRAPVCAKCGTADIKEYGHRVGVVCGSKPLYKCNKCKAVFPLDNDSYHNVFRKYLALVAGSVLNDPAEGLRILRQGDNLLHSNVSLILHGMQGKKVSA